MSWELEIVRDARKELAHLPPDSARISKSIRPAMAEILECCLNGQNQPEPFGFSRSKSHLMKDKAEALFPHLGPENERLC